MTYALTVIDSLQHMVLSEDNPHCVNQTIKMLPERLRDIGYKTHMVGKLVSNEVELI